MKKRIGVGLLLLGLVTALAGGCCFYGVGETPCPPYPSLPSLPQIVVRNIHCSEIGDVLFKLTSHIPRGMTQEWYDVTTILEYERAVRVLFTGPTHVWVALGKLKEWGLTLPTGWAWDIGRQEYLIVAIVWEGGKLKAYFWSPTSLNFVPTPENIFGIFI